MEGAVLVLVPDEQYLTSTDSPHLTVAFFGKAEDLEQWQIKIIDNVAEDLAKMNYSWATSPKVTGRGTFVLDPTFNDGHKYAYVDLIDWNVLPRFRQEIETRAGFSINRGHGFTPHMTVAFGSAWIPDLAQPAGISSFKWKSVETWIGDEHKVFPFTPRLIDPNANV